MIYIFTVEKECHAAVVPNLLQCYAMRTLHLGGCEILFKWVYELAQQQVCKMLSLAAHCTAIRLPIFTDHLCKLTHARTAVLQPMWLIGVTVYI